MTFIYPCQEFDNRLEYEKMKLEVANKTLKEKMETMREELNAKLRAADSEAQRLQMLLTERDASLAANEASRKTLQDANQKLQAEAAALTLDLRSTRSGASQAAQEIERARSHETLPLDDDLESVFRYLVDGQ